MRLSSLLLLITCPFTLFASWYNQKLEGWYYFEEQTEHREQQAISPEEADEFVSLASKKLKQLLSLALVCPSPENVASYMESQRQWMAQAGSFAKEWGKVLLDFPELGDFLTTPTSSYGILAQRDHDLQKRRQLLQKLSKDFFLIFFFKGKDPLSQKVASIVELFATSHDWKYRAVSLDGIGIPNLTSFEIDKGISQNFNVRVSPSFYIANPTNNEIYPVGAGLMSVSELEENIQNQMEEEYDE